MITLEEKNLSMGNDLPFGPEDLLTPQEAAEYLRKKWGLESWTVDAFRQYRFRHGIKTPPAWRLRDLDQIPPPDTSKRRNSPEEEGH
ncbi:MAG: hypothetical protein ACR2H5_24760 [Ktedonobacteraceae bacterium]